jgi:surfactin synthase thioesterase subunit
MVSPRLSPHESPEVDVILLGHSLGGLVAADVALMLSENAAQKHRILGLMNFDALFLGLHPLVISTGISSVSW